MENRTYIQKPVNKDSRGTKLFKLSKEDKLVCYTKKRIKEVADKNGKSPDDLIMGYIRVDKPLRRSTNDANVCINKNSEGKTIRHQYFRIDSKKHHNIKGYLLLDNKKVVGLYAPIPPIVYILPSTLAVIALFAFGISMLLRILPSVPGGNPLNIADTEDWDGSMPRNGRDSEADSGSIEIPGYANLYVSKADPDIALVNPDSNDVYFTYTVVEDNKTIYETDAIPPGKMVKMPAGSLLSAGEHDIVLKINCFDVETEESCNGADQNVKITVEEKEKI